MSNLTDLWHHHTRAKQTSPLPKAGRRNYVEVGKVFWAQTEQNQEECTFLDVYPKPTFKLGDPFRERAWQGISNMNN